jgi:hypothetical protein
VVIACTHAAPGWQEYDAGACSDCVARALDAEREVCALIVTGWFHRELFYETVEAEMAPDIDKIIAAIRALAEEGA